MKLSFHLLVVDDQPDTVGNAIGDLKDHLNEKGFDLAQTEPPALSGPAWDIFLKQHRSYDLVMVDYNLSQPGMEGDVAANKLRIALPYTDIIFYSSTESRERLLEHLAKQQVEGVFVSRRDELDTRLRGLADAVIGKAMDLTHMRGIAMAEVSEMDTLMEELLVSVFKLDRPEIRTVSDKTINRLEGSMASMSKQLEKKLKKSTDLSDIVSDGRIFPHHHKFTTFKDLAELFSDTNSDHNHNLKMLGSFGNEITSIRNHLAHGKEDLDENGNVVLRSTRPGGAPLVTDEKWMIATRQNLRKHRETLEALCSALRRYFGLAEPADDPGKDQS